MDQTQTQTLDLTTKNTYEARWSIIDNYFKEEGIAKSQVQSFDYFMLESIPYILKNEIYKFDHYTVQFCDHFVDMPRVEGTNILMYPQEARIRNMFYETNLYGNLHIVNTETKHTEIIPKVFITSIPVMVLSEYCNLKNKDITKYKECENDAGGYFIINGKERVLVSQERLNYNTVYVFPKKNVSSTYYAEIRSSNDTRSVIFNIHMNDQEKEIFFTFSNYEKKEIPIGVMYYLLYCAETEKQVSFEQYLGAVFNFVFSTREEYEKLIPRIRKEAIVILETAEIVERKHTCFKCKERVIQMYRKKENEMLYCEDCVDTKIEEDFKKMDPIELWFERYLEVQFQEDKDTTVKSSFKTTSMVLEQELFPHLKSTNMRVKAIFLTMMLRKLLKVQRGERKIDNRDSFLNKRLDLPGNLMYELFKGAYKRFFKQIYKIYVKTDKPPLQFSSTIMSLISKNVNSIAKGIKYSFSTGNWGVQKTKSMKTGVSQILNRMTYLSMLSHLRRLTAPVGKEAKLTELRQVHNSQFKIICPVETPEGKEGCGIIKNCALMTLITIETPEYPVEQCLNRFETFYSEDKKSEERMTAVLLNGRLAGYTNTPVELVKYCKNMRLNRFLHCTTSIGYHNFDNEINILTSHGRCACPLLVVRNNRILLFEKHELKEIKNLSFSYLVNEGFIEYIDTNEDDNSVVATTVDDLSKYKHIEYDYCQVDPSTMFGIAASVIPLANHCQGPRNTYQSSMCKQALGLFATTYDERMETTEHLLQYPQKAMVNTMSANLLKSNEMASGQNAIVAIMCYTGLTLC